MIQHPRMQRNALVEEESTLSFSEMMRRRHLEWYFPWIAIAEMKLLLQQEGESVVEEFGRAPLPTEFGDWTYVVFGDKTTGFHHEALVFGNLSQDAVSGGDNVLVRLHSACRTNEVYHAINCECRKELQEAMRMIKQEGRGIILYLEQEGRGTGIAGKLAQLNGMFGWQEGKIEQKRDPVTGERIDTDRAYKDAGYPSECRDFAVAGEMLRALGVQSVRLLTNNPRKIASIESAGITVMPVEIHIAPDNEIIASDLRSKAKNLGHAIMEEHLCVAECESRPDIVDQGVIFYDPA